MTRLEAVYTTNVEQERASEATADREDFYLVWGLDLKSIADVGPSTRISLDAGVTIEKHFNRTDLDNSGAPFGRFSGRIDTDLSPVRWYALGRWERTSESVEGIFVPTGLPKKKRQVGTTTTYESGLDLTGRWLDAGTSYAFVQDRYDSEEFFEEEQDEFTFRYYLQAQITRYLNIRYEVERTKTDFVNKPDGEGEWDETETISLNAGENFGLFERPKITYSIGLQREYEDGETDGWEWVHTLMISDEVDFSPTLNLRGFATYTIEQNPEDDDIAFQFGATLTHELSYRTTHSFTAMRQPVKTLGSTDDTDETSYSYNISIRDFVLPEVQFNAQAMHTTSRPLVGETEKVLAINAGLSRTDQLTSRISRRISYLYSWEDSNLESEILDEHRVTLSFSYQF